MKIIFREYIKPVIWGFVIFLALIALWAFLKIFVFGYFPVPTNSMQPSIIPGDVVFVNKLKLGPRTFKNLDFLDNDTMPVKNIRFPGYGNIERNDVIVFNYPYADSWSRARFNYKSFYVKRCIGLPGDTLSIVNGFYKVAGHDRHLGNIFRQRQISKLSEDKLIKYLPPTEGISGWTMKNFGPLYIPQKGDNIILDSNNFYFYKRLIEWETGGKMTDENGAYFLNGTPLTTYTAQKNYYFVAGDNIFDSRDSRYWGLLQEEYIVGTVPFILYSKDRQTGRIRWKRIFKSLNL